jgi:ATP-dependent DNA helicase PIF1
MDKVAIDQVTAHYRTLNFYLIFYKIDFKRVFLTKECEIVLDALQMGNVFLTGGAGVGKTYTTREIIKAYEKLNKNVIVLASTGIAAVSLGGQTVHSFLKFGIAKTLPELLSSSMRPHHRKELRMIVSIIDLLIIDEISMISAGVMEMIEYRLEQFGFNGRMMVVGDFLQLPPVRRHDEEKRLMWQYKIEEHERERYFGYAFESPTWKDYDFETIEFTEIKRTKDHDFAKILNTIREGVYERPVYDFMVELIRAKHEHSVTRLIATNAKVKNYNESKLNEGEKAIVLIQAKVTTLESKTDISKSVDKFLHNIPVEAELKLRIGAPILFTINSGEYKNGERGVIKEILHDEKKGYSLIVTKECGSDVEVKPFIFEMKTYDIKEDEKGEKIIEERAIADVSQLPVRLAWSITIHKSQGMSIDALEISLDEIFEKSQFYVALSRATSKKGVKLLTNKRPKELHYWLHNMIGADPKVVDFYEEAKHPASVQQTFKQQLSKDLF